VRCTLTRRTTSPRRTRDPTPSPCWVSAETLRLEEFKRGKEKSVFLAVLWIRLVFNADLDPAFYLNGDPDPGRQSKADPDPYPDPDRGQTFKSQKVEFLRGKYTSSR
jgi:hypothetical protein